MSNDIFYRTYYHGNKVSIYPQMIEYKERCLVIQPKEICRLRNNEEIEDIISGELSGLKTYIETKNGCRQINDFNDVIIKKITYVDEDVLMEATIGQLRENPNLLKRFLERN